MALHNTFNVAAQVRAFRFQSSMRLLKFNFVGNVIW